MTTNSDQNGGLREELRGDAASLSSTAKERLQREVDTRKGAAVDQARNLSSALGSAASQLGSDQPAWLRSALEQGSQTIQRLAESVEQKDARQLTEEARRLASQSPGTFLAGCALAGFAAARVFKAGGESAAAASSGSGAEPQSSASFQASSWDQTDGQSAGQSGQNFGGGQSSEGFGQGQSSQGFGGGQPASFSDNQQGLSQGRSGDGL